MREEHRIPCAIQPSAEERTPASRCKTGREGRFSKPRWVVLAAVLAVSIRPPASAQTPSTIEDIVYGADGKRFSGVVMVELRSLSGNVTATSGQGVVATIADGFLRIQLLPTTTYPGGAYYSVRYYSRGRVVFREFWSVPPSTKPLKLSDVRIVNTGGVIPPPAEQTLIQISDVAGLAEELEARPVKGPGYRPGRAAFINEFGAIEAVLGDTGDCVRVDGTAGPCGEPASPGPAFVDNEVPSGAVDGKNRRFLLSMAPEPASSLLLYRNGLLQKAGLDYELSGNLITFLPGATPQAGDVLLASYRVAAADGPAAQGLSYALPQILCNATGGSTSSTIATTLAGCTIPQGVLRPGDRLEVRFSMARQGSTTPFQVEIRWAGTSMMTRSTGSGDSYAAGRVEASVLTAGAQFESQSWGNVMTLASSAGQVPYNPGAAVTIEAVARMTSTTSESVSLNNFTVLRYPARPLP